jgi:hypothetical protein
MTAELDIFDVSIIVNGVIFNDIDIIAKWH